MSAPRDTLREIQNFPSLRKCSSAIENTTSTEHDSTVPIDSAGKSSLHKQTHHQKAFLKVMFSAKTLPTLVLCVSYLWTRFLMRDARRRANSQSFPYFGLLCHNIPALFLLGTSIIAEAIEDTPLAWFVALMIFRYWRTVAQIWFWFKYKPAVARSHPRITSADCTVVVPTVGPSGNDQYVEMITSILVNRPTRLIFSTNTKAAEEQVNASLPAILADVSTGTTAYQIQHNLGPMHVVTQIVVLNANVSNKRQQYVHAFSNVETEFLATVDDSASWRPRYLEATLPAFELEKVGFVGTRKWVKRVQRVQHLARFRDQDASLLTNLWNAYRAGFWNCIGGTYLVRHNFDATSTNRADGGVFCVSGRSSLIRTQIVKNNRFTEAFLNEFILRLGDHFPGWGPITADDDNFLTRFVINNGWDVKFQYSEEATMTTVLGTYPLKFPLQCVRWSRTTFRQNPIALFIDRTIWWKWPLTVWITYLPWLYNAALFWDTLAIYALTRTAFYTESSHQVGLLCCLIGFIWASKIVKTLPWFWTHPVDFFLYFIIPAYPLFAYWHSFLKVYTAFTFWDLTWSGRKLQ